MVTLTKKRKLYAEEFYRLCEAEDNEERIKLTYLNILIEAWKACVNQESCAHLMPDYEAMLKEELQVWWGDDATIRFNEQKQTATLCDGRGYEREV